MHPEVEHDKPGDCPQCGMAPEPKAGTSAAGDEENAERKDMTGHFRSGAALALPVVIRLCATFGSSATTPEQLDY